MESMMLFCLLINMLIVMVAGTQARPWMDATKSPDERVALLLPILSLEEKVNQLIHVWASQHDNDVVKKYANTSVCAR